ncbi:hypothetical protein CP488_01536 [Chthonomonas calidirosea]|nr:hypothetical protein [Chthonomonas calidirosea]CEK16525.1 hypothetical protein CP488_01536 [Chthonomonas calidirosea]
MGDGAVLGHTHSALTAPRLVGDFNKALLLDDMRLDQGTFLFGKSA